MPILPKRKPPDRPIRAFVGVGDLWLLLSTHYRGSRKSRLEPSIYDEVSSTRYFIIKKLLKASERGLKGYRYEKVIGVVRGYFNQLETRSEISVVSIKTSLHKTCFFRLSQPHVYSKLSPILAILPHRALKIPYNE
jgi:hypothetical protein